MEKKTKGLIAFGTAAAATAAAGAAAHVLTRYLMDMALDRQKPRGLMKSEKAREKIRGTAYQEEFLQDLEIAAERLKNTPTERLEITSRDGIPLVGHLLPAENPRRIILAMHGWRSSWDQDFGMIAEFWHA